MEFDMVQLYPSKISRDWKKNTFSIPEIHFAQVKPIFKSMKDKLPSGLDNQFPLPEAGHQHTRSLQVLSGNCNNDNIYNISH